MREKSKTSNFTPDFSGKPLLIVLSGPSGVGKDTVLNYLKNSSSNLKFVTTLTTRPQRPNEKDNVDYHFVTKEQFQKMIDSNEMLEWATVYGNYYGRPAEPVRQALQKGQDVIVRIDVQGALTIKKKIPQAVFVFLLTTTMEELEQRLKKRRTETSDELKLRLDTASHELEQMPMFDYVVVNRHGEAANTVEAIKSIITAEKCRAVPRALNI